MLKIVPAASLMALLFLLWGLGITHVMAQDKLPSQNNKQVSEQTGEMTKQQQNRDSNGTKSKQDVIWDKNYQEIEKELKKEQAELKTLNK